MTGNAGMAELELELGCEREGDIETVGRQKASRTVRPFEQHHTCIGQVVEPELDQLGRAGKPIEIRMHQRKLRQVVSLHQREGRGRHLDRMRRLRDSRMSMRANVVLPAPRSPERVTRSPGSSALAISIASRWVACSSGSTTEKLELPDMVSGSAML